MPRAGAPERLAVTPSAVMVRLPRGFVVALRDAGLDLEALARASGLELARLELPEPTLHAAELGALFDSLFHPPAPASVGLKIGAHARPELFGVVGLAALTASTYGGAVLRCARYKRILSDVRVEIGGTRELVTVRVEVLSGSAIAMQGRAEVELASLLSLGRNLATPPVKPSAVRLRRSSPLAPDDYTGFFGCPVRFGARANEISFPREEFDLPLIAADPEAHRLLTGTADWHLQSLGDDLRQQTRAVTEGLLSEGAPTLADVARRMSRSTRSLQRSLEREGTSFQVILDEARRSVAYRLLEEGGREIAEVAFVTGFSHLSSFYRAFRRWSGRSPGSFVRDVEAGQKPRTNDAAQSE